MIAPTVPECTACGACCTCTSARHVPVTGRDWDRLGEAAERSTVWIENRAFLRVAHDRCAALRVEGASVRCELYDVRPEVCRSLERGSGACLAALEQRGPVPR